MKRNHTVQRRVILEELQKLKNHPSAADIFALVRMRLPKISLGTVYQNLAVLADEGLIEKHLFPDGQAHFEAKSLPHVHLFCTKCGAVEDFPVPEDGEKTVRSMLPPDAEARVDSIRLELSGLCRRCAAVSEREQTPGLNV